jgi:hypothetical protein
VVDGQAGRMDGRSCVPRGLRREINPPINQEFDVTPPNVDRDWREPAALHVPPVHVTRRKRENTMFTRLSELGKAMIFYAIVFVLVVGVAFAPSDGHMLLLVAMFMPTIAVLLMLLVVTRDGFSKTGWASLGLQRAGLKGWPLAVLAPLAVLGIANAVVWNTGVATFTPPAGLDAAGWIVGSPPIRGQTRRKAARSWRIPTARRRPATRHRPRRGHLSRHVPPPRAEPQTRHPGRGALRCGQRGA